MEYILYILVTTTQITCGMNYSYGNSCSKDGHNFKQVQFWQHGGVFQQTNTTNTAKVDGLTGCNNAAKELNLKANEFKCVRSR